ncbi:MAG: tetratricopeptide repeat protein [Steroidobacteraceae bacterium]
MSDIEDIHGAHGAQVELARSRSRAGQPQDALCAYDAALALKPPTPDLLVERGNVLLDLRRDSQALESFEKARAAQPTLSDARIGQSRALLRLRRGEAALAVIDELLREHPDCAAAHAIKAQTLLVQGHFEDALKAAAGSHGLDPLQPVAYFVQGYVLLQRADYVQALAALDTAIRLNPVLAAAHQGRGHALAALQRTAEALESYRMAGRLDPNNAAHPVQIGYLLIQLNQFDKAVQAFADALERQPDDVAALQGRAQCLSALGRASAAVDAYARLLAVAPDADYMRGERFHAQLHCCDWRDFEATCQDLALRVRRGERADVPGTFMTHSDSPADQRICARTFAADFCTVDAPPITRRTRSPSAPIRIAYLSADFHSHATAFLAAGLFEAHDRSKFETYAISFGPDDGSPMRGRLERAFVHFEDVRQLTDHQIAALIEEIGIDIAVDLKGHTLGGRPRIFALRPAPVQVSFLAYPGTMGADFMDYIVADRHVIPESDRNHYAEAVIYMPASYQVNDSARTAGTIPTRCEAGLPDSGFVFCCFNSSYKITPSMFNAWMEILRAVPGSVLWLLAGSDVAVHNLRSEASRRGIDARRLIFAPRTSAADHLARQSLADLFLDTLPYNAHTTGSEALWSGVPVLTVAGSTFASRVATSLVHAVGLGQLSVGSLEAYRRLAIRIATSPVELAMLKDVLSRARHGSTLFDSRWYCRQLEAAFEEIVARSRRGEPPSPVRLAEVKVD